MVKRVQPKFNKEIYYEQRLQDVFMAAADNHEGLIYNEEVWNYMIALILRQRLATIKDTERLNHVKPSFPLNFQTFIATIHQEFGDDNLKQLDLQMDLVYEQLQNCRTLINLMNIPLLSKNELEQLSTILYHNNIRGEEAEKNLKRVFKEIKGQSEDVWGFVWTKITG